MKTPSRVLMASLIMTAACAAFAQTMPQPPASWVAFLKQEQAKRAAFMQQLQTERQAFLNSNPDVQNYLSQLQAASKARRAAWIAAHPKKPAIPL